jgi:hypothetical protein
MEYKRYYCSSYTHDYEQKSRLDQTVDESTDFLFEISISSEREFNVMIRYVN